MRVKDFLDLNPDACEAGRWDGMKYETMEEWWDNTRHGDFMFWALYRSGLYEHYDQSLFDQFHQELVPDLVSAGLSTEVEISYEETNKRLDYCRSFFNYSLYNLPLVWADRVRELFKNPWRAKCDV